MSVEKIEIRKCDFCGKEIPKEDWEYNTNIVAAVRFLTEQEEGRICDKPYVDYVKVDVCDEHLSMLIPATAIGRQGYNDVTIEDKEGNPINSQGNGSIRGYRLNRSENE